MLEIGSALDLIIDTGSVFEIRAITDSGISSGYYDNLERADADVLLLDADKSTNGIYVTLNTVNPDLLARRANRIKTRLSKKDQTTGDADIIRRCWFPIDIDPVRPSGVSSSEDEHDAALAKAEIIKDYLSELGWPEPITADSGNGAHLLYHINLPNDTESRDVIKEALNTLSVLFSDPKCNVDTANFNAARIWKLYGTVSRKGDNTINRSHRRSAVTETPPEICDVTIEQLKSLATLLPKDEPAKPSRRKTTSPIDLGSWLDSHGLGYEQKPYSDGSIFILDECPFSSAHKDGAFAIQFGSGAIFAGCHHNSCGSGSQRWSELREIYEGRKPSSQKPGAGGSGAGTVYNKKSDKKSILAAAKIAPTEEENRIKSEALRILTEEDPIKFIVRTFAEDHIGDQVIANCFTMSFASRYAANSLGLHVSISGESGKGKSHAMSTMSSLIPVHLASTNRMSDKALFYKTDLRAGSAICLDDQGLSEQMQEILKGVTTSFQKEFRYDTVNKDRNGQTCIIPERCVWWVAKVEGVGDDQVWNRMLSCWIDDTLEQDYKVMENALRNAASLPQISQGEKESILICREIWNHLQSVYVVIPYAERIRFSDTRNRRNVDMLLDLIHARAAMMQYQRSTVEHAGYICVAATEDDFNYAADLYGVLTGETGGQLTKMTKTESEIISYIIKLRKPEFTISEIQKISKLSNSVVNKAVQGYQSKGGIHSGLLEKCPAISYCDRTETIGDSVETVSRRTKVFSWDMEIYKEWAGVGKVWLEAETHPKPLRHQRKSEPAAKSREMPATNPRIDSEPIETGNENLSKNNLDLESIRGISDHIIRENVHSEKLCTSTTVIPDSATNFEKVESEPENSNETLNEEDSIRGVFAALRGPATNPLQDGCPGEPEKKQKISINPDDFKKLDISDRGPCDRCGTRYVDYIEKVTKSRQAREDKHAYRICKKCFAASRRKKADSFRALPDSLNVSGMTRTHTDFGRCDLCNSQKATWRDSEDHIHICDTCFANAGGTVDRGVES